MTLYMFKCYERKIITLSGVLSELLDAQNAKLHIGTHKYQEEARVTLYASPVMWRLNVPNRFHAVMAERKG